MKIAFPGVLVGILVAASATAGVRTIAPADYGPDAFVANPARAYSRAVQACAADASQEGAACLALPDYRNFLGQLDDAQVEVAPDTAEVRAAFCRDAGTLAHAPAIDAIVAAADGRRLVMINEVHDKPETRVLTRRLLAGLRKTGFDTLAVEALNAGTSPIDRVTRRSGFYTLEPAMANLLKTGLAEGYKVVPYEADDPGALFDAAAREQAQANNIARMLEANPDSRIVVHAGLAHIFERAGGYLQGIAPMAMRVAARTSLDPLTVDQVYSFDALASPDCRSDALHEGLHVFRRHDDALLSLAPDRFDVSVFAIVDRHGRTSGLGLDGDGFEVRPEGLRCNQDCLVQVFEARDAGSDAVPVASKLLSRDRDVPAMPVPFPGHYVVYVHDMEGRLSTASQATARPTSGNGESR